MKVAGNSHSDVHVPVPTWQPTTSHATKNGRAKQHSNSNLCTHEGCLHQSKNEEISKQEGKLHERKATKST
jgi:hypothetical protein